MIKRLYLTFNTFGKQLQKSNIGAYASGMSFFFLLSIVPILLITCAILSYLPITQEVMLSTIVAFTPGFFGAFMTSVANQAFTQYQSILPIAIVIMLWSAGKGVWGMMMGLNAANEVSESRNVILVRIRASFYSVMMIILLTFCIIMIITGESFVEAISHYWKGTAQYLGYMGNLRFLIVWFMLILFFMLMYTFLPNIKLRMKYQIPGAVISATGWAVFSWGFSLYVEYFHGFNIYGSLSTLVLIMMWIYGCMYMFLIGAHLNRYFSSLYRKIY